MYKHVKEIAGLRNVSTLMDRWAMLGEGTDWVRPERLVRNANSNVTGYIMSEVGGKTLFSISPTQLDLECVLGRTAVAMQEAIRIGLFPMIEHGGNVLVRTDAGDLYGIPAFIDADACIALTGSDNERECLSQLPSIFMNLDQHNMYHKFFRDRGSITELTGQYITLDALVRAAAASSASFRHWIASSSPAMVVVKSFRNHSLNSSLGS